MWGAPSQWSLHPKFAWGSIETTTIGKTHPTLPFLLPTLEKTSFEKGARTLAQRLDQNRTIFVNAHADLTPTHYFNWLLKEGRCNENRLRESGWIPVVPTCASSSHPWMEFVIFSSVTMIEKCQPCYGDKDVVISQAALYSYTIWVISFLFSSFFTFFKNQFFSFFRKWVWDRKTCPILCINQKCKSKPIKY